MGYNPKDKKFVPPPTQDRGCEYHGDGHDFNLKGKSTKTSGSDYNSFEKDSGLHGNFSEKDASMEYLRGRNKEGQSVSHYSATSREARLHTGSGGTAYDGRPIPEVYHPATSQGSVPPDAVVYKNDMKSRNDSLPYEQDTSSSNDKTTKPIAKHIKSKE